MSLESVIDNTGVTETFRHATDSEIAFPKVSQKDLADRDIINGIKQWRIWLMLAYQDIKLRYRRSILGPFWLTLSMAITVYSMGYLYGHLFHTDLQSYFPFLVAGMLSWALVSTCITELTDGFTSSDGLIKQIKLPYSLYIHRVVTRNFIIFFHNMIVIVPILLIFHKVARIDLNTLLIIPGLLLIYINAVIWGLTLAIIGARYRDISQIIKSLIQVVFFVTPVMWNPAVLPAKDHILVILNPFYAFIEIIRAPLMGMQAALTNFYMVGTITLLGLFFCRYMFIKYRSRIVYWL
jgi:lipopolysaccharide transport system permease protein